MARDLGTPVTILNPRLSGRSAVDRWRARRDGDHHQPGRRCQQEDQEFGPAKRMKKAEPGGWKSLSVEDRQFLAEVFKTYDKDGTGTLGADQLAPLLKALAGGVEPTPEEVQEVMDTADNDRSGAVSIDELKDVIRVWYVMCKNKDKKSSGCVVM
jgi:hypothetical protein